MKTRTLLILSAVSIAAVSSAQVTQVAARSDLGTTNTVDWGQLGSVTTNVSSGSVATATNGDQVAVSMADAGTMERVDEGNGWFGNFNLGDHMLWTLNDSSNMTISFAETMRAFGLQIEPDAYGSYTASMSVYNSFNQLLGSFSVSGSVNTNEDGSAAFLGVVSNRPNMAYVVLNTTSNSSGFAINQATLDCGCNPTPEPGALAALGLGLGGLFLRRRRS